MKYLSLFSGIGAFEKALTRLGIEYELVGFSEIDKYAIKSYCSVHNIDEQLNLGDVSKIDLADLPSDIDLITHGSPCQDFSVAGLQAGGDKGSATRSSLMWCTVDIVKKILPKYVVWENVKNLLSAKHRHNFDSYLQVMGDLGYNNYYKVLNAKDYEIPQNRERVYTISIRKDINKIYEFPEKMELKLKLKDMLEQDVDEKYYLSNKLLKSHMDNAEKQKEAGNGFSFEPTSGDGIAKSITTKAGSRMTDNFIKVIGEVDIKGHDCIKRVYDVEGVAPTLTDMQGGHRQPKVAVAMRGRYTADGKTEQQIEVSDREIANSITTVQKDSLVADAGGYRVRKLTPRECWRLMGFGDEDFDKARKAGISDTQLYKQAGNSIVVNVLEKIFKNLF